MADESDSPSTSRNQSKLKKAARAAGSGLEQAGRDMMDKASETRITPVQYHNGGKVKRGGPARLLKGERVIPRGKVKRVEKMMRKAKMRMMSRSH